MLLHYPLNMVDLLFLKSPGRARGFLFKLYLLVVYPFLFHQCIDFIKCDDYDKDSK